MRKLSIETKFAQVENQIPNTSCFSRKTFAALEIKISNIVDLLKIELTSLKKKPKILQAL